MAILFGSGGKELEKLKKRLEQALAVKRKDATEMGATKDAHQVYPSVSSSREIVGKIIELHAIIFQHAMELIPTEGIFACCSFACHHTSPYITTIFEGCSKLCPLGFTLQQPHVVMEHLPCIDS